MLRGSKRKGSLQVMLMAFVVLVIGITAPGYSDDDHDDGKNQDVGKYLRLSGPALEGTLTLFSGTANLNPAKCREAGGFLLTLIPVSDPTLARLKTAKSLEGLLLQGVSGDIPQLCLRKDQTPGLTINLIVVDVKRGTFVSGDGFITADVVLKQVVPVSHKD